MSATVESVVYLGATSEYDLTTPWGGRVHVLAQNINDSDRHRPGDKVIATWLVEHGFALPAEDAAAIADLGVEDVANEEKEVTGVD